MHDLAVKTIACFTAALSAAFIAALLTPNEYRVVVVLLAYTLTAAVMYWLVGLDDVACEETQS